MAAATCSSGCRAPARVVAVDTIAIRNVTIVEPRGHFGAATATVIVEGSHIQSIVNGDVAPPGARIIDGTSRYLMPGLWDMHVHLSEVSEASLPLFVANGVTGVRDMGSDFSEVRRWRAAVAAGALVGPRIIAAGPKLDGDGNPAPDRLVVRTPEDARMGVDALAALGVDFIKVHSGLDPERFHAIAREAGLRGLPVAGHLPDGVSAIDAARAGMASLEHFSGFPMPCPADLSTMLRAPRWSRARARCVSLAEAEAVMLALASTNTWLTPTLVSYRGLGYVFGSHESGADRSPYAVPALRTGWQRTAEAILKGVNPLPGDLAVWQRLFAVNQTLTAMAGHAGAKLLAGTDVGNPFVAPGFDLLDELELMTAAGLTSAQALQSATVGPAQFLGKSAELGAIETGRIADMVLLDADPLEDIRNVRRIHAVFANGRLFDRPALDQLVKTAGVLSQ